MYYRQSSHLREQAEDKFSNTDGTKTPRGFDFYEGSADDTRKLLPYGMNAVLLQSVETTGGAQLYIKMETESARLSPEAKVKGDEMAEKRRDWKGADVGRTVKHGANLFFPEKDKTGLSAFRENTPVEDVKAYDDLLKQLEGMDMLASTILEQGYEAPPKHGAAMKVLKGQEEKTEKAVDAGNRMRIFQMLKNMDACLGHPLVGQLVKDQLIVERAKLVQKYPDAPARFGGEIVLGDDDLHAKDGGKKKADVVELEDDEPTEKTKIHQAAVRRSGRRRSSSRGGDRGRTHLVRVPAGLEPDVHVQAAAAGGLRVRHDPELVEQAPHLRRRLADGVERDARAGGRGRCAARRCGSGRRRGRARGGSRGTRGSPPTARGRGRPPPGRSRSSRSGCSRRRSASQSGAPAGTRFWKKDLPEAPSGKRCSIVGRPPIVASSGSATAR